MKSIFSLIIACFGLSAQGAILVGPVVNPANGHSYYLLSQNTWSNAEAEAVSLGGHLATIRNAEEQNWVFSTFGSYHGALWIGLTDREKVFSFTWTSGEPLRYTNWSDTEPDNGTGGIEYYTHMWPEGIQGANPPPAGKWNDYANVNDIWGFPLFGVAEVSPASTVRVSLSASADVAVAKPVEDLAVSASIGPEVRAFTAIELSWASETNKVYRIQWTPSLAQPQWSNLQPIVLGTGTNMSVFDSTRGHPRGFYRVQIVR